MIVEQSRMPNGVLAKAWYDRDHIYRYALTRWWGPDDDVTPRRDSMMVFVMLNPSTASHTVDDPTIVRCMGFAKREGYDGIAVVNLYAYRASKPKVLGSVYDPIGPDNDVAIRNFSSVRSTDIVVCAWGADKHAKTRAPQVVQMLQDAGRELYCLGLTKAGAPRHPLMLELDAPLAVYRAAPPVVA